MRVCVFCGFWTTECSLPLPVAEVENLFREQGDPYVRDPTVWVPSF